MSRQKLKADNVEQLLEIVRALQRGEEPTQESIRKNTESVPQADSPMFSTEEMEYRKSDLKTEKEESDLEPNRKESDLESEKSNSEKRAHSKQTAKKTGKRRKTKKKEVYDDWDDEDQYDEDRIDEDQYDEEQSDEDQGESILRKFGSGLNKWKNRLSGESQKTTEQEEEKKSERESEKEREKEREKESERESEKEREKEREKEKTAQSLPDDITHWDEEDFEFTFSRLRSGRRMRLTDTIEEKERYYPPEKKEVRKEAAPETSALEVEKSEAPKVSDAESEKTETPEVSASEPAKSKLRRPEFSGKEVSSYVKKWMETFRQHGIGKWMETFRQHGIEKWKLGMLAAVIFLVVLLAAAVVHTISISISDSKKSEHVTADKELRVTVEEEPESWSSSYPVKLKFRVSKGEISEIRINGTVCEADAEGMVTYHAETWLLEAEVDTDQNQTLAARIEISMLDGDAPVIHASLKENKIELTAADARSSVTGIYYAAVQETSKMELPEYQKYSEPIPYQEDCTYYFYAQDAAGNKCVPKVTNMKQAESLVLSQETLYLFPGESRSLMINTEPAGALLENLRYESMNPELFTVSLTGVVTALQEGIGAIRISADGVADAVCTVEISNSRTVTISAIGDCTLGTDAYFNTTTSLNAYDAVNGHSYFFKNVKSIFEEDDITFANLEGTFTTSTAREDKQFAFKGDLDYTEILTSGSVEVVTLANNHSGDYGAQGLADTKMALEEAGIDYCIGDTVVIREVNGVSVAFIGIFVNYGSDASREELLSCLEQAKKKGADLTIVAFHWGSEKATQPDETQISLAHAAIDYGADLVVGHHPHVLQGIEQYQGKYIAYSLGNFCFGGNSNPSDQDTMIFQQTFTVSADGSGVKGEATIIPCNISSTADYNNYQPTPLEGDAGASIIQKLNEYSMPYQVSIAADGSVTSA